MPADKTKHQGFSLIEMVIAVVIFLILVSTATTILIQEFQIFNTGQNLINADWQGRIALDRMVRDVRATTKITTAEENTFAFHDIDGNNIAYSLNTNKQLVYLMNSTLSSLADNIQSLTFKYYNQNGDDLGNIPIINNIRYVAITMNIVNRDVNFDLSTAVYLWNIEN